MKNKNKKIIGGMFGWQEYKGGKDRRYSFLNKNNTFLFNARSAIFSIIDTLNLNQVWLPDYLCETILDAVNKTKTKINFYKINSHLKIENLDWVNNVERNDFVILIEYFGFPVNKKVIERIKSQKALVLIDAAQSLLSENNRYNCDFVVYSPRKTIGTPAGAIIKTNNNEYLSNIILKSVPNKNLSFIYSAFKKRTLFDINRSIEWFSDYKLSEKNQVIGNFKIDDFSLSILEHGIDYKFVKKRRRDNFSYLLKELASFAIFKELPREVIPLGFPILVKNRTEILNLLYKNNIFVPIHWPVTINRPHNKLLKNNEITLICDQRNNIKDLEQMVKLIKSKIL